MKVVLLISGFYLLVTGSTNAITSTVLVYFTPHTLIVKIAMLMIQTAILNAPAQISTAKPMFRTNLIYDLFPVNFEWLRSVEIEVGITVTKWCACSALTTGLRVAAGRLIGFGAISFRSQVGRAVRG